MTSLLPAFFPILFFVCSMNHPGPIPTYDLDEAIAEGRIELGEISYAGERKIKLKLVNTHRRKEIKVRIPSGLRLVSEDSTLQDQIIIRDKTLLVKAGSAAFARCVSYCTQAELVSPSAGSLYRYAGQAGGDLQKLSEFLAGFREIEYAVQQAVWVVTNDHDLKGIHHGDRKKALTIQRFVADLTGKPLPKYTVRYRESRPGESAFNAEVVTIFGAHEYALESDGLFTCKIYDEAGKEVQVVFENQLHRKGHNRFNFKLETRLLPKGKYVSRLYRYGTLFEEVWMES